MNKPTKPIYDPTLLKLGRLLTALQETRLSAEVQNATAKSFKPEDDIDEHLRYAKEVTKLCGEYGDANPALHIQNRIPIRQLRGQLASARAMAGIAARSEVKLLLPENSPSTKGGALNPSDIYKSR